MSNVIKSSAYIPLNDKKLIEVLQQHFAATGESVPSLASIADEASEQSAASSSARIEEVEAEAEEILRNARDEAERIRQQAQTEAEARISEQRALAEQQSEAARASAYQEGLAQGREAGLAQGLEETAELREEAKAVLEQAHRAKRQLIQEAEPFLVELSVGIAQRIMQRELSEHQEWTRELVRRTLSQRQMKGTITVCVSPAHFQYVHDARDELSLSIDAEADLLVVPDASVKDHGCVIRSSFGTVDARIDTQLSEIKNALLDIAREAEGEADA